MPVKTVIEAIPPPTVFKKSRRFIFFDIIAYSFPFITDEAVIKKPFSKISATFAKFTHHLPML
jgi:hypothetical protein